MLVKSEIVEELKKTGLRWTFIANYLKIDPRRKMLYEPSKKVRSDYIGRNLSKKIESIIEKRIAKFIMDTEKYFKDDTIDNYLKALKPEDIVSLSSHLTGEDIKRRLNFLIFFARVATFDKIWEIEKEENKKSDLKLTADEIYWLIKNYESGGISEKPEPGFVPEIIDRRKETFFAPETIDYKDEIKYLYKNGVKKYTIGLLYQLHEYGAIQSNSGTLFHFEKYFKKPLKVNKNRNYIFDDNIKKDIAEFITLNKIPATFENASKMIWHARKNIDPNEMVKLLIAINIENPEYSKNSYTVIETEWGREEKEYGKVEFDKKDYFSIFEKTIPPVLRSAKKVSVRRKEKI